MAISDETMAKGTCYSNMHISYVNEGFFQTKCYKESSLMVLQIGIGYIKCMLLCEIEIENMD